MIVRKEGVSLYNFPRPGRSDVSERFTNAKGEGHLAFGVELTLGVPPPKGGGAAFLERTRKCLSSRGGVGSRWRELSSTLGLPVCPQCFSNAGVPYSQLLGGESVGLITNADAE